MEKLITLSLVLALLLTMVTVGAQADPEDMKGKIFPDFSVKTIDGRKFSLSDSLKTHDLVLINFWATWCGPCCMEFPFLEEAWEQYSDRVDVIALSIEPEDTVNVLKSFAAEYGLHFGIGRDKTGMFDNMGGNAIPTTLIVNRERRVLAVEIGSKTSAEEFTDLFDSLLGQKQAQAQPEQTAARCAICFCDPSGKPVPGVQVGFCNGQYDIVESDSSGRVTFDGDPNEYHVHLLQVPDGYTVPWSQLHVSGNEYDLTVTLYSDDFGSVSAI